MSSKATGVRERPILFSSPMVRAILGGKKTQTRRVIRKPERFTRIRDCAFCCPYGAPSDRLWVRETWQHENGSCDDAGCGQPSHIYYLATESYPESMRWRPSIYMPRALSRIALEVVSVRVERLQEISEEDAAAEGVDAIPAAPAQLTHRGAFAGLWNTINGKCAPWASNPWVWVVEFRKTLTKDPLHAD